MKAKRLYAYRTKAIDTFSILLKTNGGATFNVSLVAESSQVEGVKLHSEGCGEEPRSSFLVRLSPPQRRNTRQLSTFKQFQRSATTGGHVAHPRLQLEHIHGGGGIPTPDN